MLYSINFKSLHMKSGITGIDHKHYSHVIGDIGIIIIIIITSTCDLQSSTAIANQLPGQLVSTQIRTIGM